MRSAIAPFLLAGLLLAGCEDGKPVTAPSAPESPPAKPTEERPAAPAAAAESPTPPEARPAHGATGVGDTAPVPEREPPKATTAAPAPTEWGKPGLPRPPELEGRRMDAGVVPPPGVGR